MRMLLQVLLFCTLSAWPLAATGQAPLTLDSLTKGERVRYRDRYVPRWTTTRYERRHADTLIFARARGTAPSQLPIGEIRRLELSRRRSVSPGKIVTGTVAGLLVGGLVVGLAMQSGSPAVSETALTGAAVGAVIIGVFAGTRPVDRWRQVLLPHLER